MTYRCDRCGAANEFTPLSRMDGDLEVHYLQCAECGAETVAAVSDAKLRADVELYRAMAARIKGGRMSERFLRRAQKLKEQNMLRSRELRAQYDNR